ncbi:MAG: biopolymer transporter ExbD [Planctomycetota bacterium]
MASRAAEEAKEEEVQLDMTPMIDCVFQLIIFFMLVTEMVSQDISALILPSAQQAIPDENPPENRLTVNVLQKQSDGKFVDSYEIRRRPLTHQQMNEEILKHASSPTNRPAGERLSTGSVLIRADAKVEWKSVQEVQKACMEARLWKIDIGASRVEER